MLDEPLTPAFSSGQLNYTVRYIVPNDATPHRFNIDPVQSDSDCQIGLTGAGSDMVKLDGRTVIFNPDSVTRMTIGSDPDEFTVTIRVCDPGYSPTGFYIGVTDWYVEYKVTFYFTTDMGESAQ